MFDRRNFLKATSSSAVVGGASLALLADQKESLARGSSDSSENVPTFPRFISTWRFGKAVNDAAIQTVKDGGSMLDAIEKGIWVAEADAKNGSVGLGGTPAANGVVQLDACIMNGPDHNAGSVAGIEDILHPISVARKVMENTRHVMLVGAGARDFALANGFQAVTLLTDSKKEAFKRYQKQKELEKRSIQKTDADNHDTIALVGVDEQGNMFGGCSTSGAGYKIPGRVGDSPIIGSGLYVDNDIGGAGATGLGENVMRYCATFMIVEEMRHGASPQIAIENVIRRIVKKDPRGVDELSINFVAINRKGEIGAAGTNKGFQYAVTDPSQSVVKNAKAFSNADI